MAAQVCILTLAQLICSLAVCDGVAETISLSSELLVVLMQLVMTVTEITRGQQRRLIRV